MKKKIVCLAIFFFLFSCNEKGKKEATTYFVITLNFKALEDDRFQVFYIEDGQLGYSEDRRIAKNFSGSTIFQEIKFVLPSFPDNFRIDLGENGHKSFVEISTISIICDNYKLEAKGDLIHRFFKTNIYLETLEKGFLRKEMNEKYDPFLEATPLLLKKIQLKI